MGLWRLVLNPKSTYVLVTTVPVTNLDNRVHGTSQHISRLAQEFHLSTVTRQTGPRPRSESQNQLAGAIALIVVHQDSDRATGTSPAIIYCFICSLRLLVASLLGSVASPLMQCPLFPVSWYSFCRPRKGDGQSRPTWCYLTE